MNIKENYIEFTIDSICFLIPKDLKFNIFNEPPNCFGINFSYNGKKYEILDSSIGPRILINDINGFASKDIPFNKNTLDLIPLLKVKL